MDAGSPDTWRWIWLITMVVFGVGEIAVAGSFFLAPFAIGAGVAAVLAFAGVGVGIEWAAFLGVSVASFVALRPVARRLDAEGPTLGVGAHRQVGQRARVIEGIDVQHGHGTVMLDREQWRAESHDGRPIPAGSTVVVVDVRGTRVIVAPDDTASERSPLDSPPQGDTL
jgi:membrane protein implicated in regulation of membrane protease activity